MAYIQEMLDAELRKADEVLAGRAKYPAILSWHSAVGATWQDGGFWSDGKPIFLNGFQLGCQRSQATPGAAQTGRG